MKFPPCSVVVTYDQDRQRLILQTADRAKIAGALKGESEIPVLLDDFKFKLDDEFARRFGAGVLALIALGQPDLKQYISFTEAPPDEPSDE
ncbi:hypothetical protein PQR11_28460 [Paraburkholderia strydomiana]|uniref:Uncharacterized protein n=1 Tax=Paraburkholderia caledonica TaxID=134536 RepID=A0ABU1L8N9_9BURK|nr:hypothetical protein [Paraburkholderia caledonica]MDR6379577.1 hypothetical protein [Paraburkholderia caledonica]